MVSTLGLDMYIYIYIHQNKYLKSKDIFGTSCTNSVWVQVRLVYFKNLRVEISCPEGGGDLAEIALSPVWIPKVSSPSMDLEMVPEMQGHCQQLLWKYLLILKCQDDL